MIQQAYQIDRDIRVLIARPTRNECSGWDVTQLVAELCDRISRDEADSVAIDLSNVNHMDSCCVGKLVSLRQHAVKAGGSVALAGCCPNVAFLFKMTRLDTLFGLYDSMASAVTELRERRTRPKPAPAHDQAPSDRPARIAPLLAALLQAHRSRHPHPTQTHDPGIQTRSAV